MSWPLCIVSPSINWSNKIKKRKKKIEWIRLQRNGMRFIGILCIWWWWWWSILYFYNIFSAYLYACWLWVKLKMTNEPFSIVSSHQFLYVFIYSNGFWIFMVFISTMCMYRGFYFIRTFPDFFLSFILSFVYLIQSLSSFWLGQLITFFITHLKLQIKRNKEIERNIFWLVSSWKFLSFLVLSFFLSSFHLHNHQRQHMLFLFSKYARIMESINWKLANKIREPNNFDEK